MLYIRIYTQIFLAMLVLMTLHGNGTQSRMPNTSWNYETYLRVRINSARDQLLNSFTKQRWIKRDLKTVSMQLGPSHRIQLTGKVSSDMHLFEIGSKLYVLTEHQLFALYIEQDGNETTFSSPLLHLNETASVAFVQSCRFREFEFILIAYKIGYVKVLSRTGIADGAYGWKLQQEIVNVGVATNAHFFETNDQLYVLIGSSRRAMAPSILYMWMGKHFDEKHRILTTAATFVTSIPTEYSVLLVILQFIPENPEVGSWVIGFEDGLLRRKEILHTEGPVTAVPYQLENEQYLFVANSLGSNMVYKLKGEELIEWIPITERITGGKVKIFTIQNRFFAALVFQDVLHIYLVRANKYENIKQFKMPSKIMDFYLLQNEHRYGFYLVLGVNDSDPVLGMFVPFTIHTMSSANLQWNEQFNVSVELPRILDVLQKRHKLIEAMKKAAFTKNPKHYAYAHESVGTGKAHGAPIAIAKFQQNRQMIEKLRNFRVNIIALIQKFHQIQQQINRIMPKTSQNLAGDLLVNGNLTAQQIIIDHLTAKTINQVPWVPEEWLSQGTVQTLSGFLTSPRIIANNLEVMPNVNPIFNDLLLVKGRQVIQGHVSLRSLGARSAQAFRINNIPFSKVVTKGFPGIIEGVKTVQNLATTHLNISSWNKLNMKNKEGVLDQLSASSDVEFLNITVQHINGISWTNFTSTVFQRGKNNPVTGNLTFEASLTINNLNLDDKVAGISVANLFTTTTDQQIQSHVSFRSIKAGHIQCPSLNTVRLSEQAALRGIRNAIRGPVSVLNLHVNGDLALRGELDNSSLIKFNDHVTGTQSSDLLQIYTGPVRVHGNVAMRTIDFQKYTAIFMNEWMFPRNLIENFWLKSTNQEIFNDVIMDRNVSVPHLTVQRVSGVVSDMLVNCGLYGAFWPSLHTILHFTKMHVHGAVTLDPLAIVGEHNPKLMANSAVLTTGIYRVVGPKVFNKLTIQNVNIDVLNSYDMSTWMNSKSGSVFGINVTISGDLHLLNNNTIAVNMVYDYQLQQLVTEKVNRRLLMDVVNSTTIQVGSINGHDFYKLIDYLKQQTPFSRLVVNGSVHFRDINVNSVNNIPTLDIPKIVQKGDHIQVSGKKIFHGDLKVIENLNARFLDDIVYHTFTQTLSKTQPQIISAVHSYQNIHTPWIKAPSINNISTSCCMLKYSDRLEPQIWNVSHLELSGVQAFAVVTSQRLFGTDPGNIAASLRTIQPRNFNSVHIYGNATFPSHTPFIRLIRNAVCSGKNHSITGKVTFAKTMTMQTMKTRQQINDVYLDKIAQDAMYKNRPEQVVRGTTKFLEDIYLAQGDVAQQVYATAINTINVTEFDNRLVRMSYTDVITGSKIFLEGFTAQTFIVPDTLGTIRPSTLAVYDVDKAFTATIFTSLIILNNLEIIFSINKQNFSSFLKNRLLSDDSDLQDIHAVYAFQNLHLHGVSWVASLNRISLPSIVTDVEHQQIESKIEFLAPVLINGVVDIDLANKIHLKSAFENAFYVDETVDITTNVIFSEPVNVAYLHSQRLNGVLLNEMTKSIRHDLNISSDVLNRIGHVKSTLSKGLQLSSDLATEILYIEPDYTFSIPISNMVSAQVCSLEQYVSISMIGAETGDTCGLPKDCVCSLQRSMHLGVSPTAEFVEATGMERVFSLCRKDGTVVNVLTNSLSTSEHCTPDKTRFEDGGKLEIHWTVPNVGIEIILKNITGYISATKMFSVHNQSYLVVSKYYDPTLHSYNVDSLVLELDAQRKDAQIIQRIGTRGASTIEVVESIQGVFLLIGNTYDSEHDLQDVESEIYRFDHTRKQFKMLRTVASAGMTSIGSLTADGDTFVVLARGRAPLLILKYNVDQYTFVFYQQIKFHSPVVSVSALYSQDTESRSDVFLCISTEAGSFYVYRYKFIEGFILEAEGELEELRAIVPYVLNKRSYLFAPSHQYAQMLTIVRYGYH